MSDPNHELDRDQILAMAAGFQDACILAAAAELDVFTAIADRSMTAQELAQQLEADLRGITTLLDAVAALRLLDKLDGRYNVPVQLRPLLSANSPQSILPMIWHRANILRGWSMLAWTAKAGVPAPRPASIRGGAADRAAFVGAMHTVSGPLADQLVAQLGPPQFQHLLDVGGASGTWTLAFLRAVPGSRATIFDLPDAIGQARQRIADTDLADRVALAPGDFYVDELPGGADYAWVSAIIHQHSRKHNRELFAKVARALLPGGTIAIRDIVMEPDRTRPFQGAMFAINMLANTASGNTFTLAEIAEDLESAGFRQPRLQIQTDAMNSVVVARRP